jgi:uncharacterized protein (TIGR02117 family)
VVARLARGLLWLIALGAAAIIVAAFATARPGDRSLYPATGPGVETYVVTNGWHSGIALPRAALSDVAGRFGLSALTMVTTRFADYPWIEIGFGELEFYRSVPTLAALRPMVVLRVLFRPGNAAVLHVVGLERAPPAALPQAVAVRLVLSEAGFSRLAQRMNASFAPRASGLPSDDLGPGLYGPSRFFRARGNFHLFNLCNHWVANMLDAAGIATTPVVDTLATGLLIDLRWRAGAGSQAAPGLRS